MDMINLYQLDKACYFTGVAMQVNPIAGFKRGALGWIDIAPPTLSSNEFAKFIGVEWIITNEPPPPDVPEIVVLPEEVQAPTQPSNYDGPPVVL